MRVLLGFPLVQQAWIRLRRVDLGRNLEGRRHRLRLAPACQPRGRLEVQADEVRVADELPGEDAVKGPVSPLPGPAGRQVVLVEAGADAVLRPGPPAPLCLELSQAAERT